MPVDVDVDLGAMPLEHAETLRLCVANCINNGNLWEFDNRIRASALMAMLDFKIGLAKKEAALGLVPYSRFAS